VGKKWDGRDDDKGEFEETFWRALASRCLADPPGGQEVDKSIFPGDDSWLVIVGPDKSVLVGFCPIGLRF
jgi:hypothetical protein